MQCCSDVSDVCWWKLSLPSVTSLPCFRSVVESGWVSSLSARGLRLSSLLSLGFPPSIRRLWPQWTVVFSYQICHWQNDDTCLCVTMKKRVWLISFVWVKTLRSWYQTEMWRLTSDLFQKAQTHWREFKLDAVNVVLHVTWILDLS